MRASEQFLKGVMVFCILVGVLACGFFYTPKSKKLHCAICGTVIGRNESTEMKQVYEEVGIVTFSGNFKQQPELKIAKDPKGPTYLVMWHPCHTTCSGIPTGPHKLPISKLPLLPGIIDEDGNRRVLANNGNLGEWSTYISEK